MNYERGKFSFYIFLFILLAIIVGGYIFMQYTINNPKMKTDNKKEKIENKDMRILKNKEYIYFDNIKLIIESEEIYYKNIVINLEAGKDISEVLNNELKAMKEDIKYIKDNPVSEEIEKNKEGIYSLTYPEYEVYQFDNYLSLLIKKYDYNVVTGYSGINIKSYNFDKHTGKIIEEDELLKIFELTLEGIKDKVKEKLNVYQVIEDGVELVKVAETMNNLDYGIYINKIGELEISYLVKSTKLDYYDKIVLE